MNEFDYVRCLLDDFSHDLKAFPRTSLHSIFIGGGTPSLFSPEAYERFFSGLKQLIDLPSDLEITLEANPGTLDSGRFEAYRQLGINRLSIGVQSFNDAFLKKLGRIHDGNKAHQAIDMAQNAGFDRVNIDLMYGLPGQTPEDALDDLRQAIACQTEHLSWYELTIEPNTVFYKKPPEQPSELTYEAIETQGRDLLQQHGFERYEISAYAKGHNAQCLHNLNYWTFGDYFGIGAGAHSKLTNPKALISRLAKLRQPSSYQAQTKDFIAQPQTIDNPNDILFEFMLNASRLLHPVAYGLFEARTGLNLSLLMDGLLKGQELGLVTLDSQSFQITPKGQQYNNELIHLFLPKEE